MKNLSKIIYPLFFVFIISACTNSSAEKEEPSDLSDIVTDTTETFTYQLPNGKNVDLAYVFSGSEASVILSLEGKQLNLQSKHMSDSTSVFQNGNVTIKTKRSQIFFSDAQQSEVELKLVNPIFQSYESTNESVLAVYHPLDKEKPFVILQREDGHEYTLSQKEAWLKGTEKGAVYSNDTLIWAVNGENATLKENGKTTTFKTFDLNNPDDPLHK